MSGGNELNTNFVKQQTARNLQGSSSITIYSSTCSTVNRHLAMPAYVLYDMTRSADAARDQGGRTAASWRRRCDAVGAARRAFFPLSGDSWTSWPLEDWTGVGESAASSPDSLFGGALSCSSANRVRPLRRRACCPAGGTAAQPAAGHHVVAQVCARVPVQCANGRDGQTNPGSTLKREPLYVFDGSASRPSRKSKPCLERAHLAVAFRKCEAEQLHMVSV